MEKAMAPYSSTFAWKIPWTEEPGRLQFMGSLESDTTERLHFHFSLSCIGEGNGNPLQCSCLENHGRGSLVGCHLWGHTESDTTEATQQQQPLHWKADSQPLDHQESPNCIFYTRLSILWYSWLCLSPCLNSLKTKTVPSLTFVLLPLHYDQYSTLYMDTPDSGQ